MKIRIVNTLTVGGAANAALRLHAGIIGRGEDCVFLTRDHEDDKRKIISAHTKPRSLPSRMATRLSSWAGRSFGYQPHGLSDSPTTADCELFSDCEGDYGRRLVDISADCDLLNIHWIARFIDLPSLLLECAGKVPIVWTLHDMNAFTGGCHYDMDCGRFATNCGNCPQLRHPGPGDASSKIFAKRRQTISKLAPGQLRIVTPSNWLMQQAARSPFLSKFCDSVIPNGIDTTIFRPMSKLLAREILGIGAKSRVLLFVSDALNNPRKGLDLLIKAVPRIYNECANLHLLCVGGGAPPEFQGGEIASTVVGRIANENLLASLYSAADLFVLPSRQDNLPNTALESIACGTPVVGFARGGVPDIVRPGTTGWLASRVDAESLAQTTVSALNQLTNPATENRLRESCRSVAQREYCSSVQTSRYLTLFKDLVQNPGK